MNEKVNWRILNDRRASIARACDKEEMKAMARAAIPDSDLLRIPETYWLGHELAEAPDFSSIPPCVVKPNNGSGAVIVDPASLQRSELEDRTAKWAVSGPGALLGEWGYTQARALVLIEERIQTREGLPPVDYKFFVFDGVPRVIQVNSGRGQRLQATFYDPEWRRLPVKWWSTPCTDEARPRTLDKMLGIAARLGREWDFMRVDLYSIGDQVWFGEYSPYPGGGVILWDPHRFDFELGSMWNLRSSTASVSQYEGKGIRNAVHD